MRTLRLAFADKLGVTAIEFAFLAPAFLLFVIGAADAGRALWSQATLQRTVEVAARCAAIDKVKCATSSQVQTLASELSLFAPASAFSVSSETCGVTVSASLEYALSSSLMGMPSITLTATACFPQ